MNICKFGMNCRYMTTTCKFDHLDLENTQSISSQTKKPCKFGPKCRFKKEGKCNFSHENYDLESSKAASQTDDIKESSKMKKVCNFNIKCKKPDCKFDHNTPNGKSPADPSNMKTPGMNI